VSIRPPWITGFQLSVRPARFPFGGIFVSTGPFKVVARLSRWNYRKRNVRGKESVVHVNRLKQTYKQGIWKERGQEKCYRKQRIRRQEPGEDKPAILAPGPISIPAPRDDGNLPWNPQPEPATPNGHPCIGASLWTPMDRRDWIRTTFHQTHPVPDAN